MVAVFLHPVPFGATYECCQWRWSTLSDAAASIERRNAAGPAP